MNLTERAQQLANTTGQPCWVVHPVYRPPYIARTPQDVEHGYQMLQRFLPRYPVTWTPQ